MPTGGWVGMRAQGLGVCSAHLVLPQLLPYNVIPGRHQLLQPPDAWVGEELGGKGSAAGNDALLKPPSLGPGGT